MLTITDGASPIEIWLTQKNMSVTCTVVYEDETTQRLDIDSLSMRGAQREISGYLIGLGYKPIGRWTEEAEGEGSRRFKL